MSKTVLAKMSALRALIYAVGWLLLCGVFLVITLYHPHDVPLRDYLNSKGLFRYEMAIIAWVCCALLLVRQVVIIKQLFFSESRAIWANNRKVWYLNIFSSILVSSVKREKIAAVFAGKRGDLGRRGVVLLLKNQREIFISTWVMIDSAELIAERIRTVLGVEGEFRE